ncbi:hypothetical protein O1611_g2397 [Lasiodiplodia mahajangana]|uniref:Uncharacterized protein n=1 Tax=Lasiodiplodia mahajangana TaxID=1108764 RepID=A0ACC2JVJ2_9PEZI|nr:hypothetical protein O1611_g2397 [Lasiodiplodia mahajangana]
MATSSDALLYTFYHLFLPPKLPRQDDYNARCESALLSTTIDGLVAWKDYINPAYRSQADAAISMIRTAVPLYVREQNASVLISKHNRRILFEVFEVSPNNEATMATKGRLTRSFPGAAVTLDESDFKQPQFHKTIAHTLANMSKHPVEAMQPKVKKAGSTLPEDRDTNHPGMVSELFIGFLRSIGEAAECPIIVKNMRDDVLWDDARSPWRRSPSWLLVRVSLQLIFKRMATPEKSDAVYKEAMIFILCHVLTLATKRSLSSEVLYSMSSKLSRRLLKIGPAIDGRVLLYVQTAMKDAHAKILERWSMIQKQETPTIGVTELSSLDFKGDCYVSIPELDNHIAWMGTRQQEQLRGSFQPPSMLMDLSPHELPRLPRQFADESTSHAVANLEAFETWVTLHSRQWAQDNQRTAACSELSTLIVTYHNLARPYYSKNPEALSTMILTISELWVACDDTAVSLCPLLSQYDPGVPQDVLQNLLLPFASQMRRLRSVEKYLTQRSTAARFSPQDLYYNIDSPDCFQAKYFDLSTELQETYQEIIEDAKRKKRAKLIELRNLKTKYDDLIALSDRMTCEYEKILLDSLNDFYEWQHKSDCAKCRYATQAANLQIYIHEWPLPLNYTKAKSIVFELRIPVCFQSWREATFYFLQDILQMQYSGEQSSPRSNYSLSNDPHLPRGLSGSSYIGLLSEAKPQVVTHRRGRKVSIAIESTVCVDNGLNYRYFDSERTRFIEPFELTEKVPEMCTYHLPTRSESLQKYLFRPPSSPNGPTPNVALADRSETPFHITIEEARDLATLPLGHRIQFFNLLIQLASPSLDFRKEETPVFIFQCLYQSGPPGDTLLRASHAVMDDEMFAFHLLENTETAWNRVKENWESAQALGVFAAIATRLLSLTSSESVRHSCLKLLRTLRIGAFTWVELLRDKSHTAATLDDGEYFKLKSVDIALICTSCFDVEDCHLSSVLVSDTDVSIFVQCSILVQEGKRTYSPASELTFACMSLRFHRLLYRSLSVLSKAHSGISDAIQKSWSAFRSGSGWQIACGTTHWLVTETTSDNGGIQCQVHYNLLSGELLVNGIPLSRPPREYENHPMWFQLFGHFAVEVMPTSAAGMQFSAKRQYKGYDVHFGMNTISSKGPDLLVKASNSYVDYDMIPSRLLQGAFPDHFINKFVHWYNHKNEILEFRSQEAPWSSNHLTWILSRSPYGWTLRRKGSTILGVNSKTATTIANILFPLADKTNIHIFLQPSDQSPLAVEIPKLRLGFFLPSDKSNLQSREFPGMSIDDDQSVGTLIGFTNKIVLKDENRRLVLVPEGPVFWASANDHIRVTVSKASIVKIHPLYIEDVLGRLTDNGDLQGKLFLSYLHALTSYCLPDPFTKRTGVEQALWILNSAAVRSFDQLSKDNISILVQIAQLNPKRRYYPRHEKVMQTVSWVRDLSYLSQHDGLHKAVSAIFEYASQMSLFYPGLDRNQLDLSSHIDIDEFLMERDRIRSSTFRVSDFGAEEHTTAYDVTYHGRDRNQKSARGINAYVLSSIVHKGRTTLHIDPLGSHEFWRIISLVQTVRGPNKNLHVSQLKYGADAANSGLDLSQWLALHKSLSTQFDEANKLSVMIWLSALSAHEQADMRLLQVLALLTTHQLDVQLPLIQSCEPHKGYKATPECLEAIVHSYVIKIPGSPEAQLRAKPGEDWDRFEDRRNKQYDANKNNAVHTLVALLYRQWPNETLSGLGHVGRNVSDYVQLADVESAVRQKFKEWSDNLRLYEYLERLESALSSFRCTPMTLDQLPPVTRTPPVRAQTFISIRDLFARAAPTLPMAPCSLDLKSSSSDSKKQNYRLPELLDALRNTTLRSQYDVSYIEELNTSMQSLQGQASALYPYMGDEHPLASLLGHLDECKRKVDELYLCLIAMAKTAYNGMPALGHGPRLSPLLFLQQLSSGAWNSLDPGWRECVTRYGLTLSALQRAERLVRAAISRSNEELIKELKNIGHTWDPLEHPEWLLLEVESSIMIRDVQQRIASEMINPHSRRNAVLQLNMGEGKSSVIVPMAAAEMANGSQLARVIVAKPQSKQMAQMLTSKLGGLLDRRIYFMPFSRALKVTSTETADIISKIMRECQANGGILLVQPEHLLSFQLMGIECYCDERKQAIGESFIRLQDFFDINSRDIVDESDENFSTKFELIYTMGSQRPIELSPTRWICMQQVLSLVRLFAANIADELPQSLDIEPQHDGGFPRLRILKADASELLVERVARRICDKGIEGFPIARQQEHVRKAVFKYITQYNLSPDEVRAIEESGDGGFWTESTKPLLFLLRGILAGGLLAFALGQKRWRVNFGLTTTRTPPTRLAVPYRAKDNPTPRSEFSHPDLVIALTCLSYYYGGLNDDDLFIALGHLMASDRASSEYKVWMEDSPLMPASFRQLEGINLEDRPQCITDVFPCLKYAKSVIDYFLGYIVFRKEVKEFPSKLSASGWDIGKKKAHYVTGFSGTNDSRKLLPLDMENLDLPEQSHTNALVLEHLLQPENSVILLPNRLATSITSAEYILDTVVKLQRPTRVILDVGAQILELNNLEVAQRWLQMITDPRTQAAVFVNDDDDLSVVDRQGRVELLQTSSYATRLDVCLVFLDEAHTRGIDLKLPDDYRAAVTLGANLTKDRLVQACMRLRKLGRGQSVIFCVNEEIRAKIRERTTKPEGAVIEVKDVLHWAISETLADTERNMTLWATQGIRFLRQEDLWKSRRVDGATIMSTTSAKQFLEDEAQSLEARYRPRLEAAMSIASLLRSGGQRSDEIRERCSEFEHLQFNSATLEEEQERELSPEVEQERQVQRPDPARPVNHFLHPDIIIFVTTGWLEPDSSAYMPAFGALRGTTVAKEFEPSQLNNGRLLVTADFARSVDSSGISYVSDSFQRPVQWILSSCAKGSNIVDILMIISPYEAERMMPNFRSARSDEVTLHLYKPRCHSGHRSFDHLDFFTIPPRKPQREVPRALLVQLNLFAGQLYFNTYEEYLDTCKFLGLAADVPKEGEVIAADGYIISDSNKESRFDKSPVKFLQGLTSKIRRNGQSISKTHVGSMLEGKLLQRSDIEG